MCPIDIHLNQVSLTFSHLYSNAKGFVLAVKDGLSQHHTLHALAQATRHALARCYFCLATKAGPARRHAVPPGAHIPTSPSLTPPSSIVRKIVLPSLSASAIQELLGASNIRKSTTDSIFNKWAHRHCFRISAGMGGGGGNNRRLWSAKSR